MNFKPSPHINEEVHRKIMTKLKKMTPEEIFQSSVRSGIHNPEGDLTEQYKMSNRYQDQTWYVKLWRRRHYLSIPLLAYSYSRGGLSLRTSWRIAIGMAQVKMNWLYDWEDIKRDFDES